MASLILAVDASLKGVAVALSEPGTGKIVWSAVHPENQGSAAEIARLTQRGLEEAACPPERLGGLAVSTGPGSFTGIKVGLAFAYGLRAGLPELPMLGVSGLEAAALMLREEAREDALALFYRSTRTHGYVALAERSGSVRSLLFPLAEAGALTREWPEATRYVSFGQWPELAAAMGRGALALSSSEVCEKAVHGISREASQKWPDGFGLALPGPRYLRLSTAEEQLGRPVTTPD